MQDADKWFQWSAYGFEQSPVGLLFCLLGGDRNTLAFGCEIDISLASAFAFTARAASGRGFGRNAGGKSSDKIFDVLNLAIICTFFNGS